MGAESQKDACNYWDANKVVIRDQLRENALLKKYYCDVNIGDLIKFNEEIANRLVTEPAEIIPLVRT
jgi:DNA replication licensing factor MCM5